MQMYGIKNCDTIKKAKKFIEAQLEDSGQELTFHDYKKEGVDQALLKSWVKQVGWEVLLNKRGTTWRKLDEQTKDSINEANAIKLMIEQPSIIKRPVLVTKNNLLVGFDKDAYSALF